MPEAYAGTLADGAVDFNFTHLEQETSHIYSTLSHLHKGSTDLCVRPGATKTLVQIWFRD